MDGEALNQYHKPKRFRQGEYLLGMAREVEEEAISLDITGLERNHLYRTAARIKADAQILLKH